MNDIILIHETNGRPYYRALEECVVRRNMRICYYENSVFRNLIKSLFWKQICANDFKRAWSNIKLRILQKRITGRLVIMAFAPYDFRILYYIPILLDSRKMIIWHTSWPDWKGLEVPRSNVIVVRQIMERIYKYIFYKSVSYVVGVTDKSCETVKSIYPNTRVYHIPHSVEIPEVDNLPMRESVENVLFVGKLIPEKGYRIFIDIARKLKPVGFNFTIVGAGPGEIEVQRARTEGVIDYLGYIGDRALLMDHFLRNDIMIVPSIKTGRWQELFGIVIIEAMACGLVVVASNHVGPCSILRHGENGFLVDEEDSLYIERIISNLRSDIFRYRKISAQAKIDAKKYSIENVSRMWSNLLDEVC